MKTKLSTDNCLVVNFEFTQITQINTIENKFYIYYLPVNSKFKTTKNYDQILIRKVHLSIRLLWIKMLNGVLQKLGIYRYSIKNTGGQHSRVSINTFKTQTHVIKMIYKKKSISK